MGIGVVGVEGLGIEGGLAVGVMSHGVNQGPVHATTLLSHPTQL